MVDRLEVASTTLMPPRFPMSSAGTAAFGAGFIQSVLNRSTDLSDVHRDALSVANHETLRLNRMLSDLLDLSRADNHQLTIRQEPFEVIAAWLSLKLARCF